MSKYDLLIKNSSVIKNNKSLILLLICVIWFRMQLKYSREITCTTKYLENKPKSNAVKERFSW